MASRQPARNAHGLLYHRLKAHAELHPEHHSVGHHPRAAGLDNVLHGASFVCLPVTVTKTSDHRLSSSTQRLLFRASGSLDRRPTGGAVGPRVSTGARWGARGWYSSAWPVLLVHLQAVHAPCPPVETALWRATCCGGRQYAWRGLTAGHTCQHAHTKSLVECPFLGTAPGDCGGWGGR